MTPEYTTSSDEAVDPSNVTNMCWRKGDPLGAITACSLFASLALKRRFAARFSRGCLSSGLVVRNKEYGLAADIWSLGCTVLEMLIGKFPYFDLETTAALFSIGRGERPPIPESLSMEARDFILHCLEVDPHARPTAALLLDHPFVKRTLPPSSG
ncbi:mitogen-activated kinase kinase kinase 1-like [Olea europaea subsp. europaea]|uniref:Mitogen-activated kinase kinase kinase 1-like n=1 Tax=Olea europaea subsp. europaea TaxID=158383 RepID=A0A8S0SFM1_OLEEU|nr:mitogen-activated kinase kinase kinase 1-like [Olea europaea subsp. europaea]